MEMLGLAAPPMTKGGQLAGTRLGPIRKESSPPKTAEQLLAPFRAPIAWAGWKVTLRSKECFDPNPESAKERSTG